ncbi:MAG: hypothetical protein IKA99_01725 [Clostridia bacterium]|nr:hypothetical protein [Clostridia bacterium]
MIRDQFNDVKKVTTKEARKKASMGERTYYTKRINRYQDLQKTLGISMVISTVILGIAYAIVLFVFIVARNTEVEYALWKFICWSVVFGLFFGFTLVWYVFLKPRVLKIIEECRHELERINAKTLSKAAATYALYGEAYKKQQEQKHLKEKEKIEKIAKEKEMTNQQFDHQETANEEKADEKEEKKSIIKD